MTNQPMNRGMGAVGMQALQLQYPMSLGVFDKYEDAQHAVDYLSDHEFPVQNVMIVGTDLKQIERVTGRLTTGRVAVGGLMSGAWLGLFVAMVFGFIDAKARTMPNIVTTIAIGAVFGLIWAMLGYAMTRGKRDFTSITQVVATKYEVLVEHKFVTQGREMLAQMDPMWAAREQVRQAQEAERSRAEQGVPHPGEPPAV